MLLSEVAKLEPLGRFLYWIKERHRIYGCRLAGRPKPWTDDEVLQRYFFTNPYRENDKTTEWFRKNVRDPLRDDPAVLFATVCFRWFNWIPTGKLLMSVKDAKESWIFPGTARGGFGLLTDWDLEAAVEHLTAYRDSGNQVFTGAFNISNSGSTKPKINRVCEDYVGPAWQACGPGGWIREELLRGAYECKSGMQSAHELLRTLPGLGGSGFMAYEVVCDLRYTMYLDHAADKETWSNPGPGARRGLNRLLGRELSAPCKDYPLESGKLLAVAKTELADLPLLEMREIEHSLCEWDKYERARLRDGHMKRRYVGYVVGDSW